MKIFEIDPGLFIWSMLTFILLVLLLYKFAFGPLMALQKQRQDEIHSSIRESEGLRDEAHALLEDYKKQLASARQESEDILERARKIGENTKGEILDEAKAQAEWAVEKAHEQIERETRQALQEIKAEVAALTLLATEKVTRKTLTAQDHLDLINEAIAEIDLGKFSEN
ncbi:MAG TPA: F0F1 ATP synthase subunit B [Thermoleophilia bacterium]|nr:F0F1 ATP synthase subunit B [Thermoleophilia bacterium]HZK49102.1 F0F1 ATP synthase subunit B [Thermoleophilia bacterium]